MEETEKNLISIFLSGLREDLKGKVKLAKPSTMVSTYRLACAREAITASEKKWGKLFFFKSPVARSSQNLSNSKEILSIGSGKDVKSNEKTQVIRLTPTQVEDNRRGLCFRCDENFSPGHKAKSLMVIEIEFPDEEE